MNRHHHHCGRCWSCTIPIDRRTQIGHGVRIRRTHPTHRRTILLYVVRTTAAGRPAGTHIAVAVGVLTGLGAVRTMPSVRAGTSTGCGIQRSTVVADCGARAVFPGTRTVAVAQPVLAPSGTGSTLWTRRSLGVGPAAPVVASRPVVADQIEGRREGSSQRLTEVDRTANVPTGRPYYLHTFIYIHVRLMLSERN